jgi:hypothetical protein
MRSAIAASIAVLLAVLGYLLPSRSRRELRADRILAIEAIPPDAKTS